MAINEKAAFSSRPDQPENTASKTQDHITKHDQPAQPKARLVMIVEHAPGEKVEETALIRIMRERGHQIIYVEVQP